jgi:predicted ATP-binding protein involved in virulence
MISDYNKNKKFDVFLFYNSDDKTIVEDIAIKLKEIGLSPWFDEWELRPGFPWQNTIEEQIENIKSVCVFIGKSGMGHWQDMEQKAFIQQFVNRKCPVIPVILEDCIKDQEVPSFLKGMTIVDFRKKNSDPMIRLIWGITGNKLNNNGFTKQQTSNPLLLKGGTNGVDKYRNPYVTGKKVYGRHFFGRNNILEILYEKLLNSEIPNSCSIFGETRIGKSSILEEFCYQYKADLLKNFCVIQMDMSAHFSPGDTKSFYLQFLSIIRDQLVDEKISQSIMQQIDSSLASQEPWGVVLYKISKCFTAIKKAAIKLLVILDEFDATTELFELDSQAFKILRSLGSEPKYDITYLVASRKRIVTIEKDAGISSNFAGLFGFGEIQIGLMKKNEAISLIREPAKRVGIEWEDQEVEDILEFSGCHPYIIQNVCHSLFSKKENGNLLSKKQIRTLVHEQSKAFFIDLFNRLTSNNLLDPLCQFIINPHSQSKENQEKLYNLSYLKKENNTLKIFTPLFQEYLQEHFKEKFQKPLYSPESPTPYLTEVTVENILCFGEKQKLNLSSKNGEAEKWTIILGDNNIGKTVLLQCIAALDPNLDLYFLEQQSVFKRPIGSDKNTGKISALIYGEEEKCSLDIIRFQEDISLKRTDKIFNLTCYGYGASRRMMEESLAEGDDDRRAVKKNISFTLFSGKYLLPNAEEWFLRTHYENLTEKGNDSNKKQLEDVKKLLKNILSLSDEIKDVLIEKNELKFDTPYGIIPFRGLSIGYKSLIAQLLDMVRRLYERYPKSENPLAEPAIVLIDEIDLHLHPVWQRKLVKHLQKTFAKSQFIVTSHSPLIVQADTNVNLAVLKREGDHVIIDNNPETIYGWRVDQVLTGLMGLKSSRPPELEELIEKRDALLAKAVLSEKDEKAIAELDEKIGELPFGDSIEEIEAMDIIREAAKELDQKNDKD